MSRESQRAPVSRIPITEWQPDKPLGEPFDARRTWYTFGQHDVDTAPELGTATRASARAPRRAPYERAIRDTRAFAAAPTHDPRHIEALMRVEYRTLDHLSAADFEREVYVCIKAIELMGRAEAEETARSFGL